MFECYKEAVAEDKLLQYTFMIDVPNGKCRYSLESVDTTNTLYHLHENENVVAFET